MCFFFFFFFLNNPPPPEFSPFPLPNALPFWSTERGFGKNPNFLPPLSDTPVDVRVPAAAKFDAERRPFQPKHPAEIGLEIAAVAVGHGGQRGAPHHDDRGGASPPMRLAERRAPEPRARRGLRRHGGDDGAREARGGP